MAYVKHRFLKENTIESRLYQEAILAKAVKRNTLVVLPTGMGKTALALMVVLKKLDDDVKKKFLFLAPTKPLVEQHLRFFKDVTTLGGFALMTGMVSPEKRKDLWQDEQFFFATPQVVENDILTRAVKLDDFALVIFDESHRAVGDYSYVFIAKQVKGLILALTASPGGEDEIIKQVCRNLRIKGIEIRTEDDADVKPYVQELTLNWERVELPEEFKQIKKYLERPIKRRAVVLREAGVLSTANLQMIRKKDLLIAQGRARAKAGAGEVSAYSELSRIAAVVKAHHALELLETQGIGALHKYFARLKSQKSKAARGLFNDADFLNAVHKTKWLYEQGVEHPKLNRLREVVKEEVKSGQVLVFTQYRDSVNKIIEYLKKEGIKTGKLVGQSSKLEDGMSQKDQGKMLEDFKKKKFDVLCATCIGEEGLDLPQVGTVVFFEPMSSPIRAIQRKGRTARQAPGKVIVMMAKDTRDEGMYWSGYHKEKRMKSSLKKMQKGHSELMQKKLGDFN